LSRFLIIFEGRNGSSYLVSLLNSHPAVLCYPEVLVGLPAAAQTEVVQRVASAADLRPINAYAGADRYHRHGFAAKWQAGPYPVLGFKAKVTDMLGAPGLILELQRHGYRLVHLRRENLLKSVTSHMNALKLQEKFDGISNASRPDQVMGGIEIDLAKFDYFLARRVLSESLHAWFYENFAGEKIRVSYEELIADEPAFMARFLAFIGAPARVLHGTFHKNTPPSLHEAVLNYDAFARHFAGTPYAHYLD
jgi:hypothetical protein